MNVSAQVGADAQETIASRLAGRRRWWSRISAIGPVGLGRV